MDDKKTGAFTLKLIQLHDIQRPFCFRGSRISILDKEMQVGIL